MMIVSHVSRRIFSISFSALPGGGGRSSKTRLFFQSAALLPGFPDLGLNTTSIVARLSFSLLCFTSAGP